MFKLVITKSDLSPYWIEHFNDLAACDKWLEEEKTRPYWDHTFISTIIDNTPPPPTKTELDDIAKKEADVALRESKLKSAKDKSNLTPQEVQDVIKLILVKIGL